jgi:hypothetical protein
VLRDSHKTQNYRRWRKPARSTVQMSRKLKPKHIGIPIKKTIQSSQSRWPGAKRTRMIHTIETAIPITMARRLIPSEGLCTRWNCTALTPRPASAAAQDLIGRDGFTRSLWVTLGDGDLGKSLMKMIYRKLLKTASLPVTCHPASCLRDLFV